MLTCRCGSGLHPRRCALHPERYAEHCREISAENDLPANLRSAPGPTAVASPFEALFNGAWWPR